MLRPDHPRPLTHLSPNPESGGIHEEQPELVVLCASLAVDADRIPKLGLPGTNQVWPHRESRRILDFPHFLRALGDGLVVQRPSGVITIETGQQIIRCIAG